MVVLSREAISTIIRDDTWMMNILKVVATLNLPDCWIGAGFVRSKVWDTLHDKVNRTAIPDIDVIYFDESDFSATEARAHSTEREVYYEYHLRKLMPDLEWSVTNQARMHLFHDDKPYRNSEEALSHWVETATCIAVKLDESGNVVVTAPHGIEDLVNCIVRPTIFQPEDLVIFNQRVHSKGWLQKWPKLVVRTELLNS